jgi:hypothetical protein
MARGQLNVPKGAAGTSKKKNKVAKNAFNLGFDPGFTKMLLRAPLQAQNIKNQTKKAKKPTLKIKPKK